MTLEEVIKARAELLAWIEGIENVLEHYSTESSAGRGIVVPGDQCRNGLPMARLEPDIIEAALHKQHIRTLAQLDIYETALDAAELALNASLRDQHGHGAARSV